MREYLVVTFKTTTMALLMERTCKAEGMAGRLIPLPKQIDAGCGMAWATETEEEETLRRLMTRQGIVFEQMVRIIF